MMTTQFSEKRDSKSSGEEPNIIQADPGFPSLSGPGPLTILGPLQPSGSSDDKGGLGDTVPLMIGEGSSEGTSPPPTPYRPDDAHGITSTANAAKPSAGGKPDKIKLPPYLEREITIKDSAKVEQNQLLLLMREGFAEKYKSWSDATTKFKAANLCVTLVVIAIQVVQVIVFQIPSIAESPTRQALSTILPAITGAVLAVQLKLSWAQKGYKSKQNANLYHQLLKHMDYRLNMIKAHGEIMELDAIKIWNTALQAETKHVPAFLSCC